MADQVASGTTGLISASETIAGTSRFNSGFGLIEIDVQKAIASGVGFVDHGNVLQAVVRQYGNSIQLKNAKSAAEVMFRERIPFDAVKLID